MRALQMLGELQLGWARAPQRLHPEMGTACPLHD